MNTREMLERSLKTDPRDGQSQTCCRRTSAVARFAW